MSEANCIRCGWGIVGQGKEGCHEGKNGGGDCACLCAKYPACPCGTFDREQPDVPMTVPPGTIVPIITAPVQTAGVAQQARAPDLADQPTMVILHQVDNGKASIVFIGKDKAKAFDAIMAFDKTAVLSEFSVEEEK
jgi:hypothetical protein